MNVNLQEDPDFFRSIQLVVFMVVLTIVLIIGTCGLFLFPDPWAYPEKPSAAGMLVDNVEKRQGAQEVWQAPDSTLIPSDEHGDLIRYGKDLIAHTAKYLGPKGKVNRISNGMNCQNCHLKSGTKPFGNNYAAVASTYPKFRARSGTIETMEKRINDCIERSLNGKTLDEDSREMRAMIAYFEWLGKDVKKGDMPYGTGIASLPLMDRPADPARGKIVYTKHCELCHGSQGQGFKPVDSIEWRYPPIAGTDSYNVGAGLYRLSRFAGYVRNNMPNGTTYDKPVLTDEEAWDVAAYVNSLPRPVKNYPEDWPDISRKPFDHPFGPYADSFSETQHKFGPFDPIRKAQNLLP